MTDVRDTERMLLAIDEITRLKAHYFRTLDAKEWDAVAEVFTPDASIKIPAWSEPRGRDEAMISFAEIMNPLETIHAGFMPDIVVDSATSAHAIWQLEDRLYRAIPGSTDTYSLQHGFGRYFDEYTATPDGWRVSRMELVRQRKDTYASITKVVDPPK